MLVRKQRRELLGTAWRSSPLEDAALSCPGCGRDGTARRTSLQCHATVLGHRLVAMGGPEVFLTCPHCGRAFCESGLGPSRPREALSEDEATLVGLLTAVVFSDSVVRGTEKEAARQVLNGYAGRAYSPTEFDEMLQRARRRWGDPVARLEKLADVVPASVRRRIVIGAYRVCSADGELHREESRLLDRVGEALNLSPQEVRMALREAKAVRSSVRRVLVTLPKGGS